MDEVPTIYLDMPATVYGYTILQDGCYTIVLNSRLSHERNLETYLHELSHIKNGDYEAGSADIIELFAHGGT